MMRLWAAITAGLSFAGAFAPSLSAQRTFEVADVHASPNATFDRLRDFAAEAY